MSFHALVRCAKEASVRDESDALKVHLAGVETRLEGDHAALVDAINAHTAATTARLDCSRRSAAR